MINDSRKITVGVTRDFINSKGNLDFNEEMWNILQQHPGIELRIIEDPAPTNTSADLARRFDAIMMKRSPLGADALASQTCLLKLVARNGVGYDHLDVEAGTRAGVMITITPEAARRPVASANIALMLASAHRILERDRRAREGTWDKRWTDKGIGLQGRVLGVIGLGNIGPGNFPPDSALGHDPSWGCPKPHGRLIPRSRGAPCRPGHHSRRSRLSLHLLSPVKTNPPHDR